MTDKIPSFKEEIDDIHVPIDKLDTIILNTVQASAPKRKRSIRKKVLYGVGAAVAAFGLLVGSATISPVMANFVSQIPVVGSIFGESGERGLEQVSELGLTQVVGESKTIKGNTLTIDEVFFDGTRLTVSYSLESEEPLGEYYLGSGMDFTIDGKSISHGGSSGETEITPTYRTAIDNVDVGSGELPKQFKLGLVFEGKGGERWKFSMPVHEQSSAELVTINHMQRAGSIDLTVSNLEISPLGLRFNYNTLTDENEFPTGDFGSFIAFKAVDSSGNELVISSQGGGQAEIVSGKIHSKGNSLFEPIDDTVKELTVTPYLIMPSEGGGVEIDASGNEKSIDFEPYKGEPVEFKSFTVKLP